MWHVKFLDLEDNKELLIADFKNISKEKIKLSPLEFTILQNIYNNRNLSGYDLIQSLNKLFAGTWEAKSGTIYPILSKLKTDGFLDTGKAKTPLGPLKKVYFLTKSGENIIKFKVKQNFQEQINFIENLIIEFATFYVHSFSENEDNLEDRIIKVQNLLKQVFDNINKKISYSITFKTTCSKCKAEIFQKGAEFCPFCASPL